jgi:hypothetical protein
MTWVLVSVLKAAENLQTKIGRINFEADFCLKWMINEQLSYLLSFDFAM